jgi:hypothetical protein
MGRCDFLGRQTVFHQSDADTARLRGLGLFRAGGGSIAEGYGVQTVDGNLIFCDEVALDRLGQSPGVLDAGGAGLRRMALNLQHVSLMTGQIGGESVQLLAGSG